MMGTVSRSLHVRQEGDWVRGRMQSGERGCMCVFSMWVQTRAPAVGEDRR